MSSDLEEVLKKSL